MDVFQVGVKGETFEVTRVGLGERAGKVGVRVEGGDVHEVGLDAWADLFAKLRENVEAAVVHIGPEVDGGFFGNEAEEVADGGRGVAHEADCCVGSGACIVLRGMCCVLRVA